MTRREFTACLGAAAAPKTPWAERLGVVCILGAEEAAARKMLRAASEAGFRRVQVFLPWDKVDGAYIRGLPDWVKAEGLRCEALSAYVNCVAPEAVVMNTRAEDFPRAMEMAGRMDCRRLVAWTGGYRAGLMDADERNFTPAASDAILRFLEPHLKPLEQAHLTVALESYITLACPDAHSLAALLRRLPWYVGAVIDPPNLTPVARYAQRDEVLREIFGLLRDRAGVVHLKDFRLAAGGRGYDLPAPLEGEMNYHLFALKVRTLPENIPVLAEHFGPEKYASTRRAVLKVLESA